MKYHYLVIGLLAVFCGGCATAPLRNQSVQQAAAVADFQQQQVLDNLAMFAYDYNSMPYFSVANQSGDSVTDQAAVNASATFTHLNTQPTSAVAKLVDYLSPGLIGASAQRTMVDAFTITPINDPRKLELMRCAYQLALRSCGRGAISGTCPDCVTRFKTFYTGDPNGDIRQSANGITTSECLKSDCCWLHIGCKKCAPKCCDCTLVGEHCGCYVWVTCEGREELTRLTFAILDFALNNPPQKRTKEVVYNIDEYGLPTTTQRAVGKVTATVAIDERPEGLLKMNQADEVRIVDFLDYRHQHVKDRLKFAVGQEQKQLLDDDQVLQDKLDFLHEQMKQGGLREQYYPKSPLSSGPGLLQLDLLQNTLPSVGGPPPPVPAPQ
jgi:hypothetical protein